MKVHLGIFEQEWVRVSQVANARSTIPVMGCVRVCKHGGALSLAAWNGDQFIESRLTTVQPSADEELGVQPIFVPAHFVGQVLGQLEADDEWGDLTWDNAHMTFRKGRSESRFRLQSGSFVLPEPELDDERLLPEGWLSRIRDRLLWAASADFARPSLMCVHLQGHQAFATDGFVASRDRDQRMQEFPISLDVEAAALLARVLDPDGETEHGRIRVQKHVNSLGVRFSQGDVWIDVQAEDVKAPDIAPIYDACTGDAHVTVDRKELADALRWLKRAGIVKWAAEPAAGKLTLTASETSIREFDSASVELETVNAAGEPFEVTLQKALWDRMFPALAGNIRIEYTGPGKPIMVKDEDAALESIMMPMV